MLVLFYVPGICWIRLLDKMLHFHRTTVLLATWKDPSDSGPINNAALGCYRTNACLILMNSWP